MMQNKSLCVLPFYHMDIQPNGVVKPCCEFNLDNIPKYVNVNDTKVFDSEFFNEIRKKMTDGIEVNGCKKCYFNEKYSKNSLRLEHIDNFKKLSGKEFTVPIKNELVYLNLSFSNICNNKCRMCNSRFSSNWYDDEKKLGIDIPKGIINQTKFFETLDTSSIRFVNLTGGEPLLEQNRIINFLKKCNLKELNLIITTNVTLLPNDELTSLLKKCKKIEWTLSIDAFGSLNDFIRKGSSWDHTVKHLSWYYTNFEHIKVNTVISIYNVNCYNLLLEFLKNNFPKINHVHRLADGAEWLSVKNLPDNYKYIVKEKNNSIKDVYNLNFSSIIEAEIDKEGNVEFFKDMDQKLNEIRKESWRDHNVELYQMIYDFRKVG
jgi:MoaA/NifB/PqqE/SkfB family radical SAM enzyme